MTHVVLTDGDRSLVTPGCLFYAGRVKRAYLRRAAKAVRSFVRWLSNPAGVLSPCHQVQSRQSDADLFESGAGGQRPSPGVNETVPECPLYLAYEPRLLHTLPAELSELDCNRSEVRHALLSKDHSQVEHKLDVGLPTEACD